MKSGTSSFQLLLIVQSFLIVNLGLHILAAGPMGIPGTTQTINGYDTELGNDPICWSSFASATGEEGIPFPNGELVEDFSLANQVNLAPSCPNGTWLEVFAPPEFLEPGFRPRTLQWYNYTVKGTIDLDELSGLSIVSDEGSRISVGVVACDSIRAGFCSPFIHEQANIREANEIELYGQTIFAKKRITGDRHGGTHVHAPSVIEDVDPLARKFEFETQVSMIVNDPGTFFVIGTLQFFTGDFLGVPRWRYDVANALSLEQNERLVTYQEPAKILEVSRTVRIISYVVVALAASVILFLLLQLLKHYQSQVLQISQAPFLAVFLLAALLASVSSLLFDPRKDWMCLLAYPVVLFSLQLLIAVTLGRLWRINAVVSPLLRNRFQRARNLKRNFGSCCQSQRANIRREINNTKVAIIVFLCTFPQVILQIVSLILQPSAKVVDFNAEESIGRCVCDDGVKEKESIQMYSMLLLFTLILVLLAMAHAARQLPSLLNESSVIFEVTGTSALVAVLGVGVIVITDDPTISPDVSYLVHIVIVLSITLNYSIRIMMPKLQMVWNGQTVIVSQLVADHKQSLINSTISSNPKSLMHNVTGLNNSIDPTSSFQKSWSRIGNSQGIHSGLSNDDNTEFNNHDSIRPDEFKPGPDKPKGERSTHTEQFLSDASSNKSISSHDAANSLAKPSDDFQNTKVKFAREEKRTSNEITESSPPKFLIREGEVPSRRLTIKMLDLQNELDVVTNHIMTGLEVARGDWENVRRCTKQLDEIFSLVNFDWESQRDRDEEEDAGEHIQEQG